MPQEKKVREYYVGVIARAKARYDLAKASGNQYIMAYMDRIKTEYEKHLERLDSKGKSR